MNESNTRGKERNPTDSKSSTVPDSRSYTPHTAQIEADDLYEALSSSRRRHVIRALEDGPKDLGALSRAIAAIENDIAVDDVRSQQRKRVYVGLYQSHLPTLDDWDIVEYEDTAQMVEPGPAHEPTLEAMQAVAESGDAPDREPESPSLLDRMKNFVGGGA